MVPLKRMVSCGTTAEMKPEFVGREMADVVIVDQYAAVARLVETLQQLASVALAGAPTAPSAQCTAPFYGQVEIAVRDMAGCAPCGETQAAHSIRPRDVVSRAGSTEYGSVGAFITVAQALDRGYGLLEFLPLAPTMAQQRPGQAVGEHLERDSMPMVMPTLSSPSTPRCRGWRASATAPACWRRRYRCSTAGVCRSSRQGSSPGNRRTGW